MRSILSCRSSLRCGEQTRNLETRKELVTEFLQIIGQAGIERKATSDHLHLIRYLRKALELRLRHKILFSNNVPKTIDG
jgi:hypothetical protein